MNIALYTLYNSFNYGAYLQAFALQEYMTSRGNSCSFAKVDNTLGHFKHYRRLISRKIGAIPFNIKKSHAFHKDWNLLNTHEKNHAADIAICGSDEIWSVVNSSFVSYPEFFGGNINATVKASYAPSVGQSTLSDLKSAPHAISGFKELDFISVRDENSFDFVSEITGRPLTKVLDPTFLISWETLIQKYKKAPPIDQKYMLIYTYGFDDKKIKLAKDIAAKNNLKLVSPGFYNSWCDLTIPCGSFDFLSLMQNATYVMTDTFHGTIFSILLKKNFISFANNKSKVKSLLTDLNLLDRDGDGHQAPSEILNHEPDYEASEIIIQQRRENSEQFLSSVFLFAQQQAQK